MVTLRWFFRCGTWKPTQAEWMHAVQMIQAEERKRVHRFVFKRDCKSAMAGRLLMRRAVCSTIKLENDQIILARTKRQKPYLVDDNQCQSTPRISVSDYEEEVHPPESDQIYFNISHQGDYAVLAAEQNYTVGIDVMRVDKPGSGIAIFFDRMSRQFTYTEWKFIKTPEESDEQLSRFYRLWSLKESYVKATGTGISVDLQTLCFNIKTCDLDVGAIVTNTTIEVQGQLLNGWRFEESRLDQQHWVAVALKINKTKISNTPHTWPTNIQLQEQTFISLTDKQKVLNDVDFKYWQDFAAKDETPAAREKGKTH